MSAFKLHGILAWFAVHKNHYGFYPYAKTIEVFKDQLKKYEISKGTIQFPIDKPIPLKFVKEIIQYRVKDNLEKMRIKNQKNKSLKSNT